MTGAALAATLLISGAGPAAAESGSAATGSADTLSSSASDSGLFAMISKTIICLINPQSSELSTGYPLCKASPV